MYSELVPLGDLSVSPVLDALAEREIQLLAAVQPHELDDAARLVEVARARGLSIGLWPLLEDVRGRWLHPEVAGAFEEWIERLLGRVGELDALVLDLEPPIAEVRAIADGRLDAVRAWWGRALDSAPHERIVGRLEERGIETVAAVVPFTLAEGRAGLGWQRALGTPVDGVAYDVVSSMLYTSLFEGYGLGLIERADARALLSQLARLTRARVGERASVSLGAVGVGALGDERTYRDPGELADDVGLVLAAGVDDIALFDLGGVLARAPAEPWLDALVGDDAGEPAAPTARSRGVAATAWITGVALDVGGGADLSTNRGDA